MDSPEKFDVAVIGGGIVGVATAMALTSSPGLRLVVLEAEDRLATHQTGHNSGVIHSGVYYEPGSLKALNCTTGRDALYEFCRNRGIQHERCGKIIVAPSESGIRILDELERRGRANGLKDMKRLDSREIKEHEPHVTGVAGLWVPHTGIVDFTKVTEAFADIVRNAGGEIRTGSKVVGIKRGGGGILLETVSGEVRAMNLVNCAGLQSDRVALMCGIEPGVRIVPFRGEYYELSELGRGLIRDIVYEVQDPGFPFLGVHFTRTMDGKIMVGPNAVLSLKRGGYDGRSFSSRDTVDTLTYPGAYRLFLKHWKMGMAELYRSLDKESYVKILKNLVPDIEPDHLVPSTAGVRAQALGLDGELVDDFSIKESEGMIHVLNAPSPAATASISIGRTIAGMAERNFGLGRIRG
jgi:L-2-hydroxyglutarate oxidase